MRFCISELNQCRPPYSLTRTRSVPPGSPSLLRAVADAKRSLSIDELASRSSRSTTSSVFWPALRNLVELGHVVLDGARYRLAEHFIA